MNTFRVFLYSAGGLLLLTALGKLLSSSGDARILQTLDPLLDLSYRQVLAGVGALEIIVAVICFGSRSVRLRAALVAWLATNFLVYRVGLSMLGYHRSCACMGNLTDALGIPLRRRTT